MLAPRLGSELRLRGLFLLGLAAALLGCSASDNTDGGGTGGSGAGASTTSSASGAGGGGGLDLGAGGAGQGGGAPVEAEVFAHSASTLYRLDPITKMVTVVGPFSGCDAVIDIAIDEDGVMFGTTFGGLYRIDRSTAACTFIASGGYPNSLSFVPKGTVDPNEEALVGYVGDTYTRIDKATGSMSNIGSLGGGYVSSVDVVSVIGGGTYLTVNGNGCGDCIVQVDPTTGALVSLIGPLNRASVFGLAFWGGSAYGFNDFGALFQIELSTGAATDIPMPDAPPGLSFWGAGSTTAAPLTPPE
jgi:hypothetical protein